MSTTRRVNGSEKTAAAAALEKDALNAQQYPPSSASEKPFTAPAVPLHVIVKLLAFTFAMVVLPIGSYFLTLNLLFSGNSTFAGATAALMANVVLVGYVVVAMNEDQSDAIEAAEQEKKKGR